MNSNSLVSIANACKTNDVDKLREVLNKNTLGDNDLNDHYLFKQAIKMGDPEIAKFFISHGALVNPKYPGYQKPPLFYAVSTGNIHLVKLLIENGANVNAVYESDDCALLRACKYGYLDILEILFSNGLDLELMELDYLFEAAQRGNLEVMKLLLDNGADVNSMDSYNSLLTVAVDERNIELIEFLLENRVDLDISPCMGQTAISKASCNGDLEVFNFLLSKSEAVDKSQLLKMACFYQQVENAEIVKLLLDLGANPNGPSTLQPHSNLPLHDAITNDFYEHVWYLSVYGAETEKAWELLKEDDKELKSALLHAWSPASHKKHPPCVRNGIKSLLLVAKRNQWPFDYTIMGKVITLVAFNWFVK